MHSKQKISNIDKFNYLKSNLEGQALLLVTGLELSNDNYHVAVELLKKRYGDSTKIVEDHYTELQRLSPAGTQIQHFRVFFDSFEINLRSLEAMSEDVETNQMLKLLGSKIHQQVLFTWN